LNKIPKLELRAKAPPKTTTGNISPASNIAAQTLLCKIADIIFTLPPLKKYWRTKTAAFARDYPNKHEHYLSF